MIPVVAVLLSLAGPLFWRDAAETCEAALEQIGIDLDVYAPGMPVALAHFDCDESKRQDGLARPFFRLTTASGKPPAINILWPPIEDNDVPAPDDEP
jgi:hypothetical protein